MSKQFQIVVADPPFSFSDSLKMSNIKRGAEANYHTMTMQQIKDLPINKIASPNGAILALWVPSSLLQDGLDIMKSWGFAHKQTYIWVKVKKSPFTQFIKWINKSILKHPQVLYDKFAYVRAVKCIIENLNSINLNNILMFGMGRIFRQTHEICLIGINNNKIYKLLQNKSQRSVCFAQNMKHSAKPEDLQDSLELMFPNADGKIELFARRERKDWVCLGNEIGNNEDINTSLLKYL